ncbi:MAG: glycosyltransferase family 2 protein [Candidatus Omnitrophota bacterium]
MGHVCGVDIVLVVHNQLDYTKGCIASILEYTHPPFQIFVVDNGSCEDTVAYLKQVQQQHPDEIVILRNEKNDGWVKAVNQGVQASCRPFVCVMNNDVVVTPFWMDEMMGIAESEKEIGIVNPSWEGKPEHISVERYAKSLRKFSGQFVEMDWCRGFCFLFKRSVVHAIQGLDPVFDPGYFDDWDFSVRAAQAGFRCVLAKGAFVYHYQNATSVDVFNKSSFHALFERHRKIFYQRWGVPLRIVFIVDPAMQGHQRVLQELFSKLLRQQHKLSVWSAVRSMDFPRHTNLRMNYVPSGLIPLVSFFRLWNNVQRSEEKRYDAVFLFHRAHHRLLKRLGGRLNISLIETNGTGNFAEAILAASKNAWARKKEHVLAHLGQGGRPNIEEKRQ